MKCPGVLEANKMRDGRLHISGNCLATDVEAIGDAIESLIRSCQDDTYGIHDKVRDLEERERSSVVEEETTNIELKITKSCRRVRSDVGSGGG